MSEERKIRNDILAVGLLAAIVFLVAALATFDPADPAFNASSLLNQIYQPDQIFFPANESFQNACGPIGAWTADMLVNTVGIGAYFLVVGLIAMELALFKRQAIESPWIKTTGWTLSLLALTTLASIALPDRMMSPLIGPGGYLGAMGRGILGSYLGLGGSLIMTSMFLVTGMMMWTEYMVFRAGRLVFTPAILAASAVLPFGLVHNLLTWFNGSGAETQRSPEIADPHLEQFDENDAPRTIRFRTREFESEEESQEAHDIADDSGVDEDEVEYEDDDSEVDDSEYEVAAEQEEEPATIKISEISDAEESLETSEPVRDLEEPAAVAPLVPKPHFKMPRQKPQQEPTERELVISQINEATSTDELSDYELPQLEMLERSSAVPFERQKRDALKKAEILEKTCKEFGYDVRVVEIETGPVISQYEIELAPGLRLNKITSLADDLAIAMRVPSVRIVAPIPGKNSVGVEVPNENRQMVRLRQVIEQSEKEIESMKIPLFLGADAVGAPLVADLAALPHLLIAGRTGTGKSVCLNAIISSILMTRRPDEVRMLLIDPKMVELSGYGRLPHLMHPVVTDMRKAEAILAWACEKMDERYRLLAKAGVRHVTSYNELGEEELMERMQPESAEEKDAIPVNMPFIVIVADEMADLMMTAGKEVEQHIIRIAQKSRAVGIHLILATQKPTVDVITGLIKSNLPARIAFQVASKTDSRVVLDDNGADKLLGNGDMLFLGKGTSNLLRGQGTYLSDPEINSITEWVSTGEQNFVNELVNIKVKSEDEEGDDDTPKKLENRDELYQQAISIVVQEQRGSCSLLQRAMGIGYGRAARLIDFMAEDGYVGPYNGSKAREVMMTEEQWTNIQAGDPNPVNDEDWVDETQPPQDKKVELKPKKLERIEPGQTSILAANVAFSPKRKKKPVEEIPEEEEDVEFEAVDDLNSGDSDDEHEEDEYEDDDEASEDEEYDDIDYEEDEEEEEYEESEEDDEDYEDVED
jgi:S-DNA-T family DNA segregation ATPase FtsK/SpoIIIE